MNAPSIQVFERIIMTKEKNDMKWQRGKEALKVMIEKNDCKAKGGCKGMVKASDDN